MHLDIFIRALPLDLTPWMGPGWENLNSSLDSVMTKNEQRLGLILTSSSKLPLNVSSLRLRILIVLVQQLLSTPESTR